MLFSYSKPKPNKCEDIYIKKVINIIVIWERINILQMFIIDSNLVLKTLECCCFQINRYKFIESSFVFKNIKN